MTGVQTCALPISEDNNIEEEEPSTPEEQHEAENIEEPEPPEKDPQPSIDKNKKKKHPNQQKGKESDPWV